MRDLIRRPLSQAWILARSLRQLPRVFRLRTRLHTSPRYLLYLAVQLEKSRAYQGKVSARTERLIGKALEVDVPANERGSRSVLCVGCRNSHELDLFKAAGYKEVVGIDLFASDPRIQVMDMHAMTFPNSRFDVIYSCHNFEHASEPHIAAQEFLRVLKPDGICVIEVPVRFRNTIIDLHDYSSARGLLDIFGSDRGEVLLEEDEGDHDSSVARVAFRKRLAESAVQR
ncbi:MAG TPA: class I SAM-dependent methyltransferase [Gemmatimonadaceae bacterium]|nr:class I SAM-dependent methyltransferase [Gemmatimonadaceae bacterium]